MPTTIDIPGYGAVDFPDGMSDADIDKAAGEMFREINPSSQPVMSTAAPMTAFPATRATDAWKTFGQRDPANDTQEAQLADLGITPERAAREQERADQRQEQVFPGLPDSGLGRTGAKMQQAHARGWAQLSESLNRGIAGILDWTDRSPFFAVFRDMRGPSLRSQAADYLTDTADEVRKTVKDIQLVEEATPGNKVAAMVAGAAPSLVPAMATAPVAGLPIFMAGLQSYGSIKGDAEEGYRQMGLPEDQVREKADTVAALSGFGTAILTFGFNRFGPGLEKWTQGMNSSSGRTALQHMAKEFGFEFTEEGLDQFQQGVLARHTYDPKKPWRDIINESLAAGLAGGTLAGGLKGVTHLDEQHKMMREMAEGDPRLAIAIHQIADDSANLATLPPAGGDPGRMTLNRAKDQSFETPPVPPATTATTATIETPPVPPATTATIETPPAPPATTATIETPAAKARKRKAKAAPTEPTEGTAAGWPEFLTDYWAASKERMGEDFSVPGTAWRPDRIKQAGLTTKQVQTAHADAIKLGVPEDFLVERSKFTSTKLAYDDIIEEAARRAATSRPEEAKPGSVQAKLDNALSYKTDLAPWAPLQQAGASDTQILETFRKVFAGDAGGFGVDPGARTAHPNGNWAVRTAGKDVQFFLSRNADAKGQSAKRVKGKELADLLRKKFNIPEESQQSRGERYMVEAARALVYERFRPDQIRGTPENPDKMTDHIERVAAMVDDPVLKTIAYLHDIVEDTNTTLEEIRTRFGDRVADALDAETWRKDTETYQQYIDRLSFNRDAMQSKLADIADNLASSQNWQLTEKLKGKQAGWRQAQAQLQARLAADLTPTFQRANIPNDGPRATWRTAQVEKVAASASLPPPAHMPKIVFSGGGAGAGKSTIITLLKEKGGTIHGAMTLTISADDFKTGEKSVEAAGAEGIPEYQQFKANSDPRAALVAHKESTMMAKAALAQVQELRRDTVYDATMSHFDEDWALAAGARQRGYNVSLVGVAIDSQTALARALERAEQEGRYIPADNLLAGHAAWARSFPRYLEVFPEVELWDNNGDRNPRLVLKKNEKGIEILDPQAYIRFAGEKAYEEAQRLQREFKPAVDAPPGAPANVTGGREEGDKQGAGRGSGAERPAAGEGGTAGEDSLAGGLTPSRRLADWVTERLNRGEKFTSADLFRAGDEAYGGTQAAHTYDPKDAYDAMEAGINRWLVGLNPNVDLVTARNTIGRLKAMLETLPTQSARTVESDKFQQFSTPPTHSFVANWVAAVRPGEVMLEPSAGIGGLAVFAKNAGAQVIGNELSPRRAAILRETGIADQVFEFNAEHIHAFLTPKIAAGEVAQPTVVVMNPPFSNAARTDTKSNMVGATHVEEALKLLPEGGRLVAILGEGMADGLAKGRFTPWWRKIKKLYNLRANIGIEGKEYRKYGTSFGNRIIVIDKTGPTPKEEGVVRASVNTVGELLPLLEDIRNDRPRIESASVERGGDGTITPGPSAGKPEPDAPATVGAGKRGGKRGRTPGVGGHAEHAGGGAKGSGKRSGTGGRAKAPGGGTVGHDAPPADLAPPERLTLAPKPGGRHQAKEVGVFSDYRPAKVYIEGALAPPTALVQSTAMASVDPPDPTYRPMLSLDMIKAGGISDTSLENIVYAGQAHEKLLPDGSRMGYFIGDGTGVGKGRQIGGIILDNWNQGRHKAVWVSKNYGLLADAKRDFADIGFDVKRLIDFSLKQGAAVEANPEGVAFVSYTSLAKGHPGLEPESLQHGQTPRLIATGADEKVSRMQRLQTWLGPDFDGVIAFDEAHLAGNAIDVPGKRGPKKASGRGKAVVDIQKLFPKARIVYVSATGATDVANLSYADRLGIWGHGSAFPSKQAFFDAINVGGLSAMEIVARDLKSMGRYLARTMSFEGVEQRQLPHTLTPQQEAAYNEASRSWQFVFSEMDAAMAASGANNSGKARNAALSQFFGAQQRFYNTLLTAMQMPSIIKDMKEQLKAGHSCILQIVNTNEATMNRALGDAATKEELDLETLDLSPKDTLLQYVDNSFPTTKFEPVADQEGNISYQPVRDAQGNLVDDPAAVAAKLALLDKIALLKMPGNPLEMITDTFGEDKVAEVTGRTKRIVNKVQEDGSIKRVLETKRSSATRKVQADEFQAGKRRILVFSDAGGTGFSFHASRKAKNQQRRIHYLVQAGWRADSAVQGMGRSHRTDQASAPYYVLPSTNIKGHQRFISTIARRLSELGALTGGERKAAGAGLFTEENNLENDYAEDAVLALFKDLRWGGVDGLEFGDVCLKLGYIKKVIDPKSGEVKQVNTLIGLGGGLNTDKVPSIQQFLNRVLVLEVAEQNRMFDAFTERMRVRIANAKRDGSFDPGTQTVEALSIKKLSDEVVYQHPDSTATTRLVDIETEHRTQKRAWKNVEDEKFIYVRNKRSGRVYALEDGPNRTSEEHGGIIATYYKWNTSGGLDLESRGDFSPDNFEALTREDAKDVWEKEVAALPPTYTRRSTYVVGAFLPIWDRLKLHSPKIWRVPMEGGEGFLGALVPPRSVAGLRARLGAGGGAKLTPEAAYNDVMRDGNELLLANGWKLRRVKRSGENRIELIGVEYNQTAEVQDHIGAFMERIGYKPRFFLPTGAAGIESMRKILDKSPAIQGEEAQEAAENDMAEGAKTSNLPPPSDKGRGKQTPPGATSSVISGETEVEHGFSGNSTVRQAAANDVARIRNLVAPQTADAPARFTGNLLRELNAKQANEMARAEESLAGYRKDFDRTPINLARWKYHPAAPLPRNLAFIDAYETGNTATLPVREQAAAAAFHQLNQADLARIHALGTGALTTFYANYFPHIWDNPTMAAGVFSKILAKAPLEGPKSFLKQRVHHLFEEGLRAGLKPVHDNPVDLWLLKKREIERYILAHSFTREMKRAGLMKFKYAFAQAEDGWTTINDRAFAVYGPPTVTIKEAFDAGMREATLDLLAKLGVPHERLTRIGGKRWGYEREVPGAPGSERIVTKFGGPDFVLWHELGHVLDNRYKDLRTLLGATEQMAVELRALAEARTDAKSPASFKKDVQSMSEKMAVVLQAYVHSPELMGRLAPTVKAAFEGFIAAHPELSDINDIRPGLRLGVGQAEITHGGMLKLGDYIMPDAAAKVVNNFLSPGLNSHLWYRGLREVSNLLNSVQLGLSAFHLGFTSLDAATSRLAIGFKRLEAGHPVSAVAAIISVPWSPITNVVTGHKLRVETLRPGTYPELSAIARALEQAGGRIGQDAFWKTEYSRRMKRAWHAGGLQWLKLPIHFPLFLWEQSMRPILEYIVPRQKLGVFADMAKLELLKLGPGASEAATREAMRKAWDSVDNRMGQVVYDNLFYNRAVKDIALISFRAYGWQLGKYREGVGAVIDTGIAVGKLARLQRPEFTHRMAYAMALPMMVGTIGALLHYLMTGKRPEEPRDYFQPRTGETDKNGNAVRLNLPSYVKDAMSYYAHPLTSFGHSLNPFGSAMMDVLQNRDFYNTEIRHPDDPLLRQMGDVAMFAAMQFRPFAITGHLKLAEEGAPAWKRIAPYIGITPVPTRMLMSASQEAAAEAMAARMPVGARTKEQFDDAKMRGEIVTLLRRGQTENGLDKLKDAIDARNLTPEQLHVLIAKLKWTPYQFQVHMIDSESAMKVWRIATPQEREAITVMVAAHVLNSKTLKREIKVKYLDELRGSVADPMPPDR